MVAWWWIPIAACVGAAIMLVWAGLALSGHDEDVCRRALYWHAVADSAGVEVDKKDSELRLLRAAVMAMDRGQCVDADVIDLMVKYGWPMHTIAEYRLRLKAKGGK